MALESSLAQLYAQYSRSVFRRARRLLGNGDAAKDVTQEVFSRAIDGEGRVSLEPNPLAWLYRVTTNICLNLLRDGKRRAEILSATSLDSTEPHADARIVVRRIMQGVPEELQEVAIYHYVDELSHAEIAEITGVSRRTIGNRLASFHALTASLAREAAS